MTGTKNVTNNDYLNELIQNAEEISTKLQDAVNTEVVTGYTSKNTLDSCQLKKANVQYAVTIQSNCNWTMTITRDDLEPSSASTATPDSDSSKTIS